MKKLLITLVVVGGLAGAGWAGGTYLVGSMSEEWFEGELAGVSKQAGAFGLEKDSFKRGFVSSEATSESRWWKSRSMCQ